MNVATLERSHGSSGQALLSRVLARFAPPPLLTVSQYADREIVVTSGPLSGTHWQTDYAPYQRGILDAFHEPGVQVVVVMGSSQWGKALALDTPIPTPGGWSTMGHLQRGDRVFDERGRPCHVTFATDVMLNHPCYRVRFSDGAELVADAEHQWYVESDTPLSPGNSWRGPGPRDGVLTTEAIARTWQLFASRGRKHRHRYAIPVARPLDLPTRELPVDPYVVGLWLGDGTTQKPSELTLNKRDLDDILSNLHQIGVEATAGRHIGGAVTVHFDRITSAALRSLGLVPKQIPDRYLRASIEQRLALLQGLMDTDGAIDADGRSCEFCTTAPAIASVFGELLLSLGLKHSVRSFVPKLMYRGEPVACAPAWRFDFTAYADSNIFRVSWKRNRLPSRGGKRTSETERRRIVGVDATDSVPVKCIAVDSPSHLYLAGRGMIPTHNTACAVNIVAYHMAYDPCGILVIEPTVDPMAKDFARNRLEPVIASSRSLSEVVSKKRAKDSSNTILTKTFRGGAVSIGGANSASSLAARAVRLLVLDEIDRYPPELPGEGNTIAIALKRTMSYGRRRRVLILSSPTLRDGPIHAWFQRGDQRRFQVPCPTCGAFFDYQWSQVRWAEDDPATARLHCPHCDHGFDDVERLAVLAKGHWQADHPERRDKSIVSFHLWEAYSPLSSLGAIVSSFLQAHADQKHGDKSTMHTWQNTTLGEPIEPDKGDGVEPHALLVRREPFDAAAPRGVCLLTMGVDVQDDRLELLVVGWGPGEESWILDRDTLGGDTSQAEPWTALNDVLERTYLHASGVALSIHAACIDSAGHRTTMVYDYAARKAARRVYAIIGRDGQRPLVSSPSPRRWGREQRKVPLYTVGVDAAKALWVSRLNVVEKGRGYVHLPLADWCDEELAAQLTSERLLTRFSKGVPTQVWKKMRPRNEALDCAVYALAALRLSHPDLDALAARLNGTAPRPPASEPAKPASAWLPKREDRWLHGRRR